MAWEVSQQCEADVDEQICATATDHEDADGWDLSGSVSMDVLKEGGGGLLAREHLQRMVMRTRRIADRPSDMVQSLYGCALWCSGDFWSN